MSLQTLHQYRNDFLKVMKREILFDKRSVHLDEPTVNIADADSRSSSTIARRWADHLPGEAGKKQSAQTSGTLFTRAVKTFLEDAFLLFRHLREGEWIWASDSTEISHFDQYGHLKEIREFISNNAEMRSTFGEDYIVKPDIAVYKRQLSPRDWGGRSRPCAGEAGTEEPAGIRSPLFKDARNAPGLPLLLASISCKLKMRSDRAQNTRTEALNLIRNRKGGSPKIVAVTAEPMPTRLASIAMGTGDIDCTYHAGLPELLQATEDARNEDQLDMLQTLVEGRRLRDISDLPLDLTI